MNLQEFLSLIEPGTAICLTHKSMFEDWYRNPRVVPERMLRRPLKVTEIGAIHPESNEFKVNQPALRIYVEEDEYE